MILSGHDISHILNNMVKGTIFKQCCKTVYSPVINNFKLTSTDLKSCMSFMSHLGSKFGFLKLTFPAIFLCLLGAGCSFTPKKYFSKKFNLAGAITYEPSSYEPVETGTIHVSSEEVLHRRDFRGSKTTLMWGLFTLTDY